MEDSIIMNKLMIILFASFLLSCNNKKEYNIQFDTQPTKIAPVEIKSENVDNKETKKEIVSDKKVMVDDSLTVNGVKGLLVYEDYPKGELKIKNKDGSIYTSFDFEMPESDEYYSELDSTLADFDLFTYHPDCGILMFQSNLGSDSYLIQTKSGEIKLIPKSNKHFKYYTWAEFLLSDKYLSIKERTFNSDESLKYYSIPSDSLNYTTFEEVKNEIITINAIQVENNWIQIKRESIDNDSLEPFYGWTKWTENNELIIDFWFLL